MTQAKQARIIFITGTDTGVGKTVLTALLAAHLRQGGCKAWAMKPFCSGGRGDVALLRGVLDGELSEDQINPFFFPEPIAPLVAARRRQRSISLREVIRAIRTLSGHCECLLIEGAGGLLAPLGERWCALDLIRELRCRTIIVARNRLGAINHTLLTVRALRAPSRERLPATRIALMNMRRPDASAASNATVLSETLGRIQLITLPFLKDNLHRSDNVKRLARRLGTPLKELLQGD